jgi:hypothetical protein
MCPWAARPTHITVNTKDFPIYETSFGTKGSLILAVEHITIRQKGEDERAKVRRKPIGDISAIICPCLSDINWSVQLISRSPESYRAALKCYQSKDQGWR